MPPEVVFIIIAGMASLTSWIYMGTRTKKGPRPEAFESMEKRLARLEVAIDDMAAEMGRVSEGQQFLTKVLADRTPKEIGA
jgi:hypothetical protein